jgi:hypothetical protein
MLNSVRVLTLAGLLAVGTGNKGTAAVRPDTAGLQFLGFRAGARLEELDAQLRRLGGQALACRRSRRDPRVTECRGSVIEPELGGAVDVWVSAIDSAAGVITISGVLDLERLEQWRDALQQRYGSVGPSVQGAQRMLQWVRRGRMLRLTWRLERTGKVTSVSLVDGKVLDEWGRSTRGSPAMKPARARAGA